MAIEIKNETEQSADLYLSGSIIDDDMGGIIDEWCDNSTGYQWPEKIRSQLEGLKGKALIKSGSSWTACVEKTSRSTSIRTAAACPQAWRWRT